MTDSEEKPMQLSIDDLCILVRSPYNAWGKGKTLKEALTQMKQHGGTGCTKMYQAFLVHKDSYCEDVHGWIMSPPGCPPREIHSVGKPKKEKSVAK